ncbi:helix-turn-helix domain-containing protein [Pseudomonas mucidolens]|uniref:Uncharacterized protein n=1 Tax=Pseudomonas mucidolens TaxID=46679 RepID=A0A1H2MUP0_9PSED|nr:helix-turn-helix transcriptional regulator [Pseudomonas mucidolens]SDU96834.1 hypothetical protein SAMN05216202_2408 [Pseudomonas mucidolens]SQH33200.1 peptidase S24, S26A and S26B [Pseudomonas mucidolens]
MIQEQQKEIGTGRRSTTFRAVGAEYSGVRLRVVLKECRIAPMEFALFVRISPQRLNNWFSRGIPEQRLKNIARLLSVNADWLAVGTGEKYVTGTDLRGRRAPARTFCLPSGRDAAD